MQFFKLVTDYIESKDVKLVARNLDRPSVELLWRQQLFILVQEYVESTLNDLCNEILEL